MENEYVSQDEIIFNEKMSKIKEVLDEKHGKENQETPEYKEGLTIAVCAEMRKLISENEQMKRQLIRPRN